MRVARLGIWHRILLHIAGLWIQLPDISPEVRRVPHIAFFVRNQPVRSGLRRQLVLLELFGLGIEMPQYVGHLPEYHTVPSGANIGSCGRDPGVGTIHSLMVTSVFPAMICAAGCGLGGKFFTR